MCESFTNLREITWSSALEGSMEILFKRIDFIESMCSSRFRLDAGLNLSVFYSLAEDSIQIDEIFFSVPLQLFERF